MLPSTKGYTVNHNHTMTAMHTTKKLLSTSHDAKTVKGEAKGYLTSILYLAPFTLSGINVCPHASESCAADCLYTAGRGAFTKTQQSRVTKTQWFHSDRDTFLKTVTKDIEASLRKAERMGYTLCVRLNGTSDLPWENIRHKGKSMMEMFDWVQFYDYTKVPIRMKRFLAGDMPANYHLTFSRSGENDSVVDRVINDGGNVSVVFKQTPPADWNGVRVINGDESDLRFLDPKGVVVGLTAKGRARRSTSSFVVNN